MTRLEDVFTWEHFPFTPFPGKVSNREHLPVFHPDRNGRQGSGCFCWFITFLLDHDYPRRKAIFILHVGPILRHICDHVMEFGHGVKLQLGLVWPFPVKRCRIWQGLPKPLLKWSRYEVVLTEEAICIQTSDQRLPSQVMLHRFFVVVHDVHRIGCDHGDGCEMYSWGVP